MKSDKIAELLAKFEAIARMEGEVEFWLARDLQPLLGYERWENFAALLERAQTACEKGGQAVGDHFREVTKMVPLGSGALRPALAACRSSPVARQSALRRGKERDEKTAEVAFLATEHGFPSATQPRCRARSRSRDF